MKTRHTIISGSSGGQSLSEYGLASFLVAIVAIPVLSVLSIQVGDTLPDLLDRIFGGTPPAVFAAHTEPGTAASANATGNIAHDGENVTLHLGNGRTITIADYPQNIGASIETAGANGTTSRMMSSLQSLIRQLEEAGEIDRDQAGRLEKLANQGHKIAGIEAILEESVEQIVKTGSTSLLRDETFTVNGKTYWGAAHLAGLVGNSIDDGQGNHLPGPEMRAFLDLHEEAKAGGALENPAVAEFVDTMVTEVWHLGDRLENRVHWVDHGELSPEEFRQSVAGTSDITHGNSAGICKSGGGKDSGTRCGG